MLRWAIDRQSRLVRPMADITRLLQKARGGDEAAENELLPLVYDKLRDIARQQLGKVGGQDTVNPTALVHEAYLKLFQGGNATYQNRLHFFAVSSQAMRFILVDHARRHLAQRRGGGVEAMTLDESLIAGQHDLQLLIDLDESLTRLAVLDERLVQVVEYLFFGGLSQSEVAEQLKISERTVRREWTKAKAWLTRELGLVP